MQDLSSWTPRPTPTNTPMTGRHVAIVPYDETTHAPGLWEAFGGLATNDLLYHFGWPPMEKPTDLGAILTDFNANRGFVTCVFTEPDTGAIMGMASYMRIDEKNGVCEVGCVAHGAPMARSRASTEAHYLMARRVFDEFGYRRYEWKLNNANEPSHRAAQRFGFSFEGIFRQLEVKPYGNRDTAWYSMLDKEWPQVKAAFAAWLDDTNFDGDGRQRTSLSALNARQWPIGNHTFRRCTFDEAKTITVFQRAAYGRIAPMLDTEPIPMSWDYAAMMEQCEFWRLGGADSPDAVLILRLRSDDLYLESVATAAHAAGQGLGTIMLDAAMTRARTLNRDRLRLITNAKNPAAPWYERAGFEIEQREERPGRAILHFAKDI